MERFFEELPALIVTVLLLALVGLLLLTGTVPVSNPLIDIITAIVIPFWFLNSAFKWQPKAPAQPQNNTAPVETK